MNKRIERMLVKIKEAPLDLSLKYNLISKLILNLSSPVQTIAILEKKGIFLKDWWEQKDKKENKKYKIKKIGSLRGLTTTATTHQIKPLQNKHTFIAQNNIVTIYQNIEVS